MQLEAGKSYVVSIVPTDYFASESLRDLDEESRKCRFMDERPEEGRSLFSSYTQKGCELECKIRQASR